MRILRRLGMTSAMFALLWEVYFTRTPSVGFIWLDVALIAVGVGGGRVLVKAGLETPSRPGLTVYRVNGKVRVRRKVDYRKLESLERELRLGDWDKPTAIELEHAILAQKSSAPIPTKEKAVHDFYGVVMDNIVAAYRINTPMMGRDMRKKDFPRFDSIHPMDEPYPIHLIRPTPPRCLCNYAGCLDCNPH